MNPKVFAEHKAKIQGFKEKSQLEIILAEEPTVAYGQEIVF